MKSYRRHIVIFEPHIFATNQCPKYRVRAAPLTCRQGHSEPQLCDLASLANHEKMLSFAVQEWLGNDHPNKISLQGSPLDGGGAVVATFIFVGQLIQV